MKIKKPKKTKPISAPTTVRGIMIGRHIIKKRKPKAKK